MVVVTLEAFASYSQTPVAVSVLIALLVCLIPTTIGGLLSAIGIAGMDRLVATTSSRCRDARWRRPAMSIRSCSTRPALSRSATDRPPSSDP